MIRFLSHSFGDRFMTSAATGDTIIKLSYREKVPVSTMKEVIGTCLQEQLQQPMGYDGEKSHEISKLLADTIRERLKALGFDRYKFIVQVLIGERREQGVRMGTRCFWDSNADNQASESFLNVRPYPPLPCIAFYVDFLNSPLLSVCLIACRIIYFAWRPRTPYTSINPLSFSSHKGK